LFIDFIQSTGQYHLFDEIESVLVKPGVDSFVIFKAPSHLIVELNCLIVDVDIGIGQLLEHILERVEALLIAVQAGQMEAVSIG
jgi:hypothetical protein